jgi:predicted kinase
MAPDKPNLQDLFSALGRMDPRVCGGLQDQIDSVVSVAGSSLADSEKVAQLSQILAQSLAALSGTQENEAAIGSAMKQYQYLIQQLLTTALASGQGENQGAPANAQEELKKLKILTANYVGMMKLLCPGLKLPESVDKR